MNMHKNARLMPIGRERMVRQVLGGEAIERVAQAGERVAQAGGVSVRTVCKWTKRYRLEGADGLHDRSSRPHRLNNPTPRKLAGRIIALRCQR